MTLLSDWGDCAPIPTHAPQRAAAWAYEEVILLRKLHAAGLTYKQIGSQLGRSEQAVHAKAQRIGVASKANAAWTEPVVATVKGLWGAGWSASRIAAKIGTTRNAVIGKLHRLGITSAHGGSGPANGSTRARDANSPPRVKRTRKPSFDGERAKRLRIGSYGRPTLVEHKPVEVRAPVSEPASLDLPLGQWTENSCKWIHGDGDLACGHETFGRSYCPHHAARAVSRSPGPGLRDATLVPAS